MARLIAHGAVLVVVFACAATAHAEEDSVPADIATVAEQFGIDATDLWGAVLTTKAPDARTYLCWVGQGPCPKPPAPVVPAATARVLCIESKESGGENVWHGHTPPAPGTDKPGGVLQYYGLTFARGAAEMGHPEWSRWVPWQAEAVAAHDLAMNRRSQWTVSGC